MVGCVNSPTEFTEFTEVWGCCWLRGYGRMPYPPTSVRIRANPWEVLLNQKSEFRGRLQFLDAEASDDAEDESMSVGVLFEVVYACLAPVAEVADAPRGVQRTEVEREHLS